MNNIEVPYLPISEFDVSQVSKEFLGSADEISNDDKCDLKKLSGGAFPDEVALILLGMGMEKHVELFKKLCIDLEAFLNINESELEEIGITDPNDRKIIAKNLKFHQKNRDEFIISENHIDDLNIAKNVFCHLLLLQHYCAYVELQMRKQILTDYPIDKEDTACTFLKAFTECALTQSQIMSKTIYDVNGTESLVDKFLKTYNLTLPKPLAESLPNRKRRRKYFFKFMVVIGFSSFLVLTGRYLMRRS